MGRALAANGPACDKERKWALGKDENMFSGQCPVAERQSDLSSRRVSSYRNACPFQLGTGEATGENRCDFTETTRANQFHSVPETRRRGTADV